MRRVETFVGRESEVEELEALADEALAGHGRLALLSGDPGIGKTRLADEATRRIGARGVEVLWGACWQAEGLPAFWPWIQILRTLLTRREGTPHLALDSEALEEVARIVPEARTGLPRDYSRAELPADEARFRLFDAVATLLREASEAAPLAVVLDDLHWADVPSLRLLSFLARQLRGTRLMILGTYREIEITRDHPLARMLAELPRDSLRIPLTGLDRDEVGRLAATIAGREVEPESVEAIWGHTAGNPFYVREIVRLLSTGGHFDRSGIAGALPPLPQTVRDVIDERLARLPEGCLDVLLAGSLLGQEFEFELLSEVMGEPRARVRHLLDEAIEARVLVEAADTAGSFVFSHPLVRIALYEQIPPHRRAALHMAAAETLVRRRPEHDRLSEIAHHFYHAGPQASAPAIEYLDRAGQASLAVLAYEAAAQHFRRALELTDRLEGRDHARRHRLLLALGDARRRAGNLAGARKSAMLAIELARSEEEGERLAEAVLALGEVDVGEVWTRPWQADEKLVALLEEAVGAVGERRDALAARCLALLAASLHFSPRRELGVELSERALAIATDLADPAVLAYCLAARHLAAWGPDNAEERLSIAGEVLRWAGETSTGELALQARVWRMADLLELGDVERAHAEVEAYATLVREARRPHLRGYVPFLRAPFAVFEGRLAEAERLADEARDAAERAADENVLGSYWCTILPLRRWQGRLAETEEGFRAAARVYAAGLPGRIGVSWICAQLGKESEARTLLEDVVGPGEVRVPKDAFWLGHLHLLAEICAALGDAARAGVLLEALRPYASRQIVAGRDGVSLYGSATRDLGLLAATAGDVEAAASFLEQAIEHNERMGSRPWAAQARCDYARMLLSRRGTGDAERAAGLLRAALDVARELGMKGLEEGSCVSARRTGWSRSRRRRTPSAARGIPGS